MNEFWEMVQEFLRPAGGVQPNIQNHPPENAHEGGALEEPPQAPEPAEPWKRRLSVYFPEMIKVYSDVTNDIMSSGLEISTMDTESLRECVEEVHKNPNYLKSLIRGRLPD
ncbi:hypothetical protein Scep_031072 [Stephania cephalantha]|uniref:Uncharacterized protein n=1 Tax=Stephania cephalantha TaxID=152367 RepID=A0AAP0DXR1_9MAGN